MCGMWIQRRDKEYIRRIHGGEYRRSQNDTNLRINWVDDERHGAHRSRCIPLAYVCTASDGGVHGTFDVDRNRFRTFVVFGDRGVLRGNGEAVSGYRQFLLFRGAIVPESRQGVEVRTP